MNIIIIDEFSKNEVKNEEDKRDKINIFFILLHLYIYIQWRKLNL
jgi:hypothetical protein